MIVEELNPHGDGPDDVNESMHDDLILVDEQVRGVLDLSANSPDRHEDPYVQEQEHGQNKNVLSVSERPVHVGINGKH